VHFGCVEVRFLGALGKDKNFLRYSVVFVVVVGNYVFLFVCKINGLIKHQTTTAATATITEIQIKNKKRPVSSRRTCRQNTCNHPQN
jgi:hypothetical protein